MKTNVKNLTRAELNENYYVKYAGANCDKIKKHIEDSEINRANQWRYDLSEIIDALESLISLDTRLLETSNKMIGKTGNTRTELEKDFSNLYNVEKQTKLNLIKLITNL
jgi:hypothetical protein